MNNPVRYSSRGGIAVGDLGDGFVRCGGDTIWTEMRKRRVLLVGCGVVTAVEPRRRAIRTVVGVS